MLITNQRHLGMDEIWLAYQVRLYLKRQISKIIPSWDKENFLK